MMAHFKRKKIDLLINLFLILNGILLIYLLYKDFIYWNGTLRSIYIKYHIIFTLSFVTLFILKFSNEIIKIYFLIFTLSGIFAIYSAEIYLIIKKPVYKDFDTRSKFEVYEEYKSKSIDIVPTFDQSYFLSKENYKGDIFFGGVSNKFTIFCNETGRFSTYKSDRYGFNNPDYVWDQDIDYLIIGDSFTHGGCVGEKETLAAHLRELTNKNVVSLGYGGTGPLIQLAILKEFSKNKKIKNIINFYYENDIKDLEKEKKYNFLFSYLDKNFDQNLILNKKIIERDNEILKVIKRLEEEKNINYSEVFVGRQNLVQKGADKSVLNYKKTNFFLDIIKLKTIRRAFRFDYYFTNLKAGLSDDVWDLYGKILNQFKLYAAKKDANFHVVLLPANDRFLGLNDIILNQKKHHYKDKVIETLLKENVINFDFYDEITKFENPSSLYPFGTQIHFTSDGYKEIIKFYLKKIN